MEGLKIVALSIVASIVYGTLHDLVTANLCVEYFSVFHPDIFHTKSPWLLALGWGVVATWWMGLFLGLLIAAAARSWRLPKLTWPNLVVPLVTVMGFSYIAALVSGVIGFHFVGVIPDWVYEVAPRLADARLNPDKQRYFTADLYAHHASYIASAVGALILCFWIIVKRIRTRRLVIAGLTPI